MRLARIVTAMVAVAMITASCKGGSSQGGGSPVGDDGTAFFGLVPFPALEALTPAEVESIISSAVAEALARNAPSTIVVVDRVGNVLAAYQMTGAPPNLLAFARAEADGSGLDGLNIPSAAGVGAIAKAVTGAYLSSNGNAFSTRTASQIVQENFNPTERNQAGGPLFGVQFSQMPCSDLSVRFQSTTGGLISPTVGPKRSPLGLSADPGGLPLYKNGEVVGGIGVVADGVYGLDRNPRDIDPPAAKLDELIALAGTRDFLPRVLITASRITVEGKSLRYTDRDLPDDLAALMSAPGSGPAPGGLGAFGSLVSINGYYDMAEGFRAGAAYGDPASGYAPASALPGGNPYQSQSAYVLVDGMGNPRFPPRDATDAPGGDPANRLTAAEVREIIDQGLGVSLAGRAQIRRPIGSRLQVTVSVVDTNGEILGVARTPDGPIFGTDVAVQKGRSAMFFSSAPAADELNAAVEPAIAIPDPDGGPIQPINIPPFSDYVAATDAFAGPGVLRGANGFTARGLGNLARPFFPDGINANANGPISRPFNSPDTTENWSPFSTGLQLDLVVRDILEHVLFILGASPDDTPLGCTPILARNPMGFPRPPLANGLQIFAGSVPVYRNGILIGAVGVSGDGIDQDDMVATLSLGRAAPILGNGIMAAPKGIRSDTLTPKGVRLRYVSCPFDPFLESDAQNVCEGQ